MYTITTLAHGIQVDDNDASTWNYGNKWPIKSETHAIVETDDSTSEYGHKLSITTIRARTKDLCSDCCYRVFVAK